MWQKLTLILSRCIHGNDLFSDDEKLLHTIFSLVNRVVHVQYSTVSSNREHGIVKSKTANNTERTLLHRIEIDIF